MGTRRSRTSTSKPRGSTLGRRRNRLGNSPPVAQTTSRRLAFVALLHRIRNLAQPVFGYIFTTPNGRSAGKKIEHAGYVLMLSTNFSDGNLFILRTISYGSAARRILRSDASARTSSHHSLESAANNRCVSACRRSGFFCGRERRDLCGP